MARQRIGLTQTQRLQLTHGLAQSIRLLQMDAGGLTRFLEEQSARNPFLVLEEPPILPVTWLPRWSAAFAAARRTDTGHTDPEMPAPSLMAHVLTQIQSLTRSARERQIALVLAEALEPSGWLGRPRTDLARQAGCAPADAEAVLMRLQQIAWHESQQLQTISGSDEAIKSLTDQLANLESANSDLNRQAESFAANAKDLEEERNRLIQKISEFETQVREGGNDVEELKIKLVGLESANKQLHLQLEELKSTKTEPIQVNDYFG